MNKFYILNKMKRRRLRWFIFCQLSTKITLEKERWIAKMGLIISNFHGCDKNYHDIDGHHDGEHDDS